jgi:hypothetical protein
VAITPITHVLTRLSDPDGDALPGKGVSLRVYVLPEGQGVFLPRGIGCRFTTMFNSTSVRPPFFAGWHSGTGLSVGGAEATALFGVVAFLVYSARVWVWRTPSSPNEIPEVGGLHILNALSFFSRRYDFMKSHFERKGFELFRFCILQVSILIYFVAQNTSILFYKHEVVGVSGEAGRKVFFGDKDLNLVEGYKILRGAVSFDVCFLVIVSWWLPIGPRSARYQ